MNEIFQSVHADIPMGLYEEMVKRAKQLAIEGDAEARRWLLDESRILKRNIVAREFNSIKRYDKKVRAIYGQPCSICGKISNTIDHIIPICEGGTNDLENLRPMCHSCNCKKTNLLARKGAR